MSLLLQRRRPRRSLRARTWAPCLFALVVTALLGASAARAQPAAPLTVRIREPSCSPAWWSTAGFISIVTVEALAIGVRVDEAGRGSLGIDLECDEGSRAAIAIGVEGTLVTRIVELRDVSETARMRALALLACDLLTEARGELARAPSAESVAEEVPERPADAPASIAPSPPPSREASRLSSPLSATPAAHAPAPPPSPAIEATLSLRGRASILAGPTLAGGGNLELEVVFDHFPLALVGGLDGEYGRASSTLGVVEGGVVDASLGARALVDVGVLRIGAAVLGALGYARIDGHASTGSVIARARESFVVAVDAELSLAVALGDVVRASLVIGVRGWAEGLDGRTDGRPTFAFSDAVPFAALGLGGRL